MNVNSIIKMSEENTHVSFAWGVESANQALRVGWGCPLVNPINNITQGISSEILGYINYFVPLAEFTAILSLWVLAIGAYYIASIVLRWIKAVS